MYIVPPPKKAIYTNISQILFSFYQPTFSRLQNYYIPSIPANILHKKVINLVSDAPNCKLIFHYITLKI